MSTAYPIPRLIQSISCPEGIWFQRRLISFANLANPTVAALAVIAEFERQLIRGRTGEGRRRAMEAAIRLGRNRSSIAISGGRLWPLSVARHAAE